MRESTESIITIQLDPTDEVSHFEYLIRLLYDENLSEKSEDSLQLLVLADKFQLDDAVEHLIHDFKKHFPEGSLSLTAVYNLLELRNHESLSARESVRKFLIDPAKNFIIQEFKRWDKVIKKNLNNFLGMPGDVLLMLLESDDIEVDSENTIFLTVLEWLQAGSIAPSFPNPRLSYVEQIFNRIRFPRMRTYYLLDFINQIPLDLIVFKHILKRHQNIALQFQLEPNRILRLYSQIPFNIFEPRQKTRKHYEFLKFNFSFNRTDLSSLQSKTKIYHGYIWTFSLMTETVPGQEEPALYGILQCRLFIGESKYYLPVRVWGEFWVQDKTNPLGPWVGLYEDNSPTKVKLLSSCNIGTDIVPISLYLGLLSEEDYEKLLQEGISIIEKYR